MIFINFTEMIPRNVFQKQNDQQAVKTNTDILLVKFQQMNSDIILAILPIKWTSHFKIWVTISSGKVKKYLYFSFQEDIW